MRTKPALALSSAFVGVMFVASAVVGSRLPETMVTQWNTAGQPNDTMSKFWGQFFMPLMTVGVLALLAVVPRIDPDGGIERVRPLYNDFIVIMATFLALTHGVVLAVNLGYNVPINSVIYAGAGLVVFYSGLVIERAEQNWFVGIRTPWTLNDETVWDRTHAVGAPLFKLSGILAVAGAFVPRYAMVLVVGPVTVSALALVVYSYYLFEQQSDGDRSTPE